MSATASFGPLRERLWGMSYCALKSSNRSSLCLNPSPGIKDGTAERLSTPVAKKSSLMNLPLAELLSIDNSLFAERFFKTWYAESGQTINKLSIAMVSSPKCRRGEDDD